MGRAVVEEASDALAELGTTRSRPEWREGRQALPFSELSGDEFEVFCFLLLKREHPEDKIYYYGKTGDAGRDIVHIRADGTVRLIQCKCYGKSVGIGDLRAELAKLYTNIFKKIITQHPGEVTFYVAPDLTSPAAGLLDDRSHWRSAAKDALKTHLKKEALCAELLEFANSWWPEWGRDNALVLTERCAKHPDLRDQFFGVRKVIDASREQSRQDTREEIKPVLDAIAGLGGQISIEPEMPVDLALPQDLDELAETFREASTPLLTWPTTLGDDRWLPRDELDRLAELIQSQNESTTLLLGPPGSGKSALLARLGQQALELGYSVLGIKADKLEHSVSSPARLAQQLQLPALPDACVRFLATRHRVLVLIDQLDALADLVDLRSERLNVLLGLIKRLHGLPNVHVVCSCRRFEFSHDSRLATLGRNGPWTLKLPAWEEVCELLGEAGIDAKNWPEQLQESLRVPQYLKVFLQRMRGTTESQVFMSYQQMLDDLWEKKVSIQDESELLMDLAEMMGQEESFWLPIAKFEEREALITGLVSKGILFRPDDGPKVGFQHQTLLEHAQARAFARGYGNLTSHVLARQDGLFVRPTLWSTLSYLREAAPQTYATEMQKLSQADLRLHVKYLLIEFLGHIQDPTDQEAVWLLQWLHNPEYRNKTLAAVQGNPGWFERLKNVHLPTVMRLGINEARAVVWMLASASHFARADCLRLIERHWLDDDANDPLTLDTLRQFPDWDEQALEFACRIVARTEVHTNYVMRLAKSISESRPELAPKFIATHFNAELKKLEALDDPPPEPLPEDATEADRIVQQWNYRPKERFNGLLDGSTDLYNLPSIAKAAPKAFIDELWPWFLKALEYTLDSPHDIVRRYRASRSLASDLDKESRHDYSVLYAIDAAMRELAVADTAAYKSFIESSRDFDALVVQRYFCRSLVDIAASEPELAVEFLLYDPRRLSLGGHVDEFSDTRNLISALAPHVDAQQMERLEQAILTWTEYHPNLPDEDAGTRFRRRKWDRERRLYLLTAIPFDRLRSETQALARSEETALPEYHEDVCNGVRVGMELVSSPMSVEQMSKASDDNVVHLFEELTDATGWNHPRHSSRGGSIEASGQLAELAKNEPQRAAALLDRFSPGTQDRPAGAIIRGLGDAKYPAAEMYELIIKLNARGFTSSDFRDDAAHALCAIATREDGLSPGAYELLEQWLDSTPPSTDRDQEDDRSGERPQSVLWGGHGGYTLPHGTYWMIRALTYGYLREQLPQTDRWLAMLEKHVEREEDAYTWQVVTEELRFLHQCNREAATQFLTRLFERFPTVRDSRFGALLLARLRSFLITDPYVGFLKEMRDSQWSLGAQAFGELAALRYLTDDDVEWPESIIAPHVRNLDLQDETTEAIRVGIAFAAAKLWRDSKCRQKASDLLVQLAEAADGDLAVAVMSVFISNDCLYADDRTRSLLTAVAENPRLLVVASDHFFAEKLEDLVESDRDLIYRICQEMVRLRGSDLADIQMPFFESASHITNIGLTLQRIGGEYREKGLELFESLLVLGVDDAQNALNELDRRARSTRRL